MTLNQALQKREQMVADAKAKHPTAAFYVGIVHLSRAIDKAKENQLDGDHLESVAADIDSRYHAERDGK